MSVTLAGPVFVRSPAARSFSWPQAPHGASHGQAPTRATKAEWGTVLAERRHCLTKSSSSPGAS